MYYHRRNYWSTTYMFEVSRDQNKTPGKHSILFVAEMLKSL